MSERLPPFYCPYCGEEDIQPFGEIAGEWLCTPCLRVWRLRGLGMAGRGQEQAS